MEVYYSDYYWKNGIPKGKAIGDKNALIAYRIIKDPYYKRISLEKYVHGNLNSIVYDSNFLDFRKLNSREQAAWKRSLLEETENYTLAIIRNEDDRALYYETCFYEQNICLQCELKTVQGIRISIHKTMLASRADPFDGIILYDMNDHIVMTKKYLLDPASHEFTELLEENWDLAL